MLCCISYFGESCTGGDGFAAFVHVGRPGKSSRGWQKKWKCQEFIYLGNTVLVLEVDTEENLVQITDECDRFCRQPIGLWEQLSQQE